MSKENENYAYLGDGVYSEYDGYYIHLHVNDHRSPRVVAIEQEVLQSLVNEASRRGWKIKVPQDGN